MTRLPWLREQPTPFRGLLGSFVGLLAVVMLALALSAVWNDALGVTAHSAGPAWLALGVALAMQLLWWGFIVYAMG